MSTGVGKTSLLQRYTHNKFDPKNTTSTTGAFFVTKKVFVHGLKVRLQLWDTAGQERFRSMVCLLTYFFAAEVTSLNDIAFSVVVVVRHANNANRHQCTIAAPMQRSCCTISPLSTRSTMSRAGLKVRLDRTLSLFNVPSRCRYHHCLANRHHHHPGGWARGVGPYPLLTGQLCMLGIRRRFLRAIVSGFPSYELWLVVIPYPISLSICAACRPPL
jgi:hypothetical protein